MKKPKSRVMQKLKAKRRMRLYTKIASFLVCGIILLVSAVIIYFLVVFALICGALI